MVSSNLETEAKFYIRDLPKITARIQRLNARLIQPRALEVNLRFDTPHNDLRRAGRVLRLRHDGQARITYKGAGRENDGILSRTEIEFVVEDLEKARLLLEALGYKKVFFYEKFRATYLLNGVHLMLDELPFGNFIEIEGQSSTAIQSTATIIGLKWTPIEASYHALFERVCKARRLEYRDFSFENFKGMDVTEDELGVSPAD
jgi:adenylate cyclase class 2